MNTLAIRNPANGQLITTLPADDATSVATKTTAARVAQPAWAATPMAERKACIERFRSGRAAMLTLLKQARPEDWQRPARHPEYERYGLAVLARHVLLHDHWHMYRMEEVWLTTEAYLQGPED